MLSSSVRQAVQACAALIGVAQLLGGAAFVQALPQGTPSAPAAAVRLSGDRPSTLGAGTYGRANYMCGGVLMGVYTAFDGGNNSIVAVTSEDDGATWQHKSTVISGQSSAHDIDNGYPLALPSGRILVAFRNHDRSSSNGNYSHFRISTLASDDAGATWTDLTNVATDDTPQNGLWEPLLRLDNEDQLQIYYSRENSAISQLNLMRTSPDLGKTWTSATTVSGGEFTDRRDGMTGVSNIGGTNLMAVFESEDTGKFQIWSVTSADDGKTWANRQLVYAPSDPSLNANAPQIVDVGGTLVTSFMTDEDVGNGGGTSNEATKVVTSSDGGKTWGNKLTVAGAPSAWPGLVTLDDDKSALVFFGGGPNVSGQKIQLAS